MAEYNRGIIPSASRGQIFLPDYYQVSLSSRQRWAEILERALSTRRITSDEYHDCIYEGTHPRCFVCQWALEGRWEWQGTICAWCRNAWGKSIRRYYERQTNRQNKINITIQREKQWLKEGKLTLKKIQSLLRHPEALQSAQRESQQDQTSPV